MYISNDEDKFLLPSEVSLQNGILMSEQQLSSKPSWFFFRAMLGNYGSRRLKSLWEQETRIYLPNIGTASDWSPWAPASVEVRKNRNNAIKYK